MKFVCLGYIDPNSWAGKTPRDQEAMMDECFTYDEVLKNNGHFAGGEGLQGPTTAKTLWFKNGKVVAVDGPYAETKEQLGGILILEARDLNHAVELMSKHPGVRFGPFEIRPAADMTAFLAESEQRRRAKQM